MTARFYAVAGALFLALTLPSCGGSSSTNPTTTTTTTLPACTQTTVFSGPGALPTSTLVHLTFTTSTSGRVDVIVDWTFASSNIGVYLVPGNSCSVDQFNARSCNFLFRSESGAKPRKVSAPNVAAGSYDVLMANFSGQDESASLQVILASAGCQGLTAAAGEDAGRGQVSVQQKAAFGR